MIDMTKELLVDEIADDLFEGKTIVVLVSDIVNPREVEHRIWSTLQEKDRAPVQRLFLSEWEGGSPVTFLGDAFSLRWGDNFAPRTVESIFVAGVLPSIVISCSFSEILDTKRRDWLNTVKAFDAITTKARAESPVFCLVAKASDPMLNILALRPSLKVKFWYNLRTRTALEAQLQREYPRHRLGESIWQAALLASLTNNGGEDFVLHLKDAVLRSKKEIYKQVASFARQIDRSSDNLRAEEIEPFIYEHCFIPLERLEKTHPIFHLWARGLMNYSPEYGWEAPSWALSVLGHMALLEHRLWRAQIKVVMPVVDRLRLLAVQSLRQAHGSAWLREQIYSLEFWEREWEATSCWQAELLELITLLNRPQHKSRWETALLSALESAHSIRNYLAHYRPIEAVEYFDLLQKVAKLEQ